MASPSSTSLSCNHCLHRIQELETQLSYAVRENELYCFESLGPDMFAENIATTTKASSSPMSSSPLSLMIRNAKRKYAKLAAKKHATSNHNMRKLFLSRCKLEKEEMSPLLASLLTIQPSYRNIICCSTIHKKKKNDLEGTDDKKKEKDQYYYCNEDGLRRQQQ
jgi:hypothetical protein